MPELILVLVIALIVFGPGKLPDVGKALGKGINEFKRATTEIEKIESIKVEPVKTESAKAEPAKAEPVKAEIKPEEKK